MKETIIFLSLKLLICHEHKQEVFTTHCDFNESFQNLNVSNNILTNDPFSENNCDQNISAYNNHGPDYWNTW